MKKAYPKYVNLLLAVFTMFCTGKISAQQLSDTMCIYYRQGYRYVDASYGNNRAELDRFINSVRHASEQGSVDRLVIYSYTSPDGSVFMNKRLAGLRADSVESYVRHHVAVPVTMIDKHAEGIDWSQLRMLVAASDRVPNRGEILEILDNTPQHISDNSGQTADSRKSRLKLLRGGIPYRYMSENFFPLMRKSAVISYYNNDSAVSDTVKVVEHAGGMLNDGAASERRRSRSDAGAAGKSAYGGDTLQNTAGDFQRHEAYSNNINIRSGADHDPLHCLAVKTNLLYDIALMPSLEVEYRIDDRWSVALEGDLAWWKNDSKHKYYQVAAIIPEGRYWFSTRKAWHGHYIGIFAGGTLYDLENGGTGYQGEALVTGISYGYMWPLSRSLSLEVGAGIGYAYARYDRYHPRDGHYLYQQTRQANYFGPLKLKLALVWRLWDKNKEKGGAR